MKKAVTVSLLALILCCACAAAAAAPAEVALINLQDRNDPLLDGIAIVRQNPAYTGEWNILYHGDRVIGANARNLPYIPYAYGKWRERSDTDLEFVREEPGLLDTAIKMLDMAFNFHQKVVALTGTTKDERKSWPVQYPLPGYTATLLPSVETKFGWGPVGSKELVIRTPGGEVVSRQPFAGRPDITLKPEQAGLKPGQTYVWQQDGVFAACRVAVLPADIAGKVVSELTRLDQEQGPALARTLKKVTYLQMLSDLYPEKIDLYWLSYQYLLAIPAADKEDKNAADLIDRFIGRVNKHLNETAKK